ncbi:hypothetical protein D1J90_09860, partial [Campylobacter jejuni]|nr:hypothetical protein [Campylobacter jejuni]
MCRKIEVKNFGPIKYIDIKVKPLTILIGKSGTGKSALMKLIHCLNTLITFISFTNIEEKLDIFDKNKILEFDLLEFDLNEEGFRNIFKNFEIEVFLNNETEITYHCDNIFIEIKNNKIKAPYSKCKTLMEQSFISDLRYMIPEILNYNIDHTLRLSDILNNTMEYFIRSLKFHKNSFKLEIFEMELLKKQNRVSNEFILKTDDYAINYNSASSGIKSTSIIEAIISYLTQQTLQERKNNFKNHLSRISKSELDNITKDFQTSIFIEEPELSLFPQDQQKILYFILKSFLQPKVNPKECNKL